jgi:glycyl-tRNA synthetase beta chain
MADFLLELLSEEIPARMQANARNELARLFAECTGEAGLTTGPIDVYSTPRRLALIARDVAPFVEPKSIEVKGPRTSAPPQAIEGFLRKVGKELADLEDRDGVYFLQIDMVGLSAGAILQDAISKIVADFSWPKSMRWGDGDLRWVRPLHGIVAMLGEEIVPVDIDGITSGATTVGHRFHHPGCITIGGACDYVEKLRACHVIVDQDERERIIREGAVAVAAEAGLTLLEDGGLVVENAGLAEWPVPLIGRFDDDYLDVPREVIVLTMRTNQKYFACANDEGLLAPAFVCIANIAAKDGGEAIVEGNRRVLTARLADARFFWEQDLKVPLEEQAKKLSGIVFHDKLGTVADKVDRVAKLARWLVESGVIKADADQVERAARLAKADLVTGMVGEFPELQGLIGGYLAEAQGEPKAVADAIRDHYGTPVDSASAAVALADKLDTIFEFFKIGEKPTGSKDPYALRRAAIQSLLMIMRSYRLDLKDLAPRDVIDFFIERWIAQNRAAGGRPDLIQAVDAVTSDGDLCRLGERMRALEQFVETEEGRDLLTAYKRAANILKKENWTGPQVMSSADEQGIPQTGEEDPLVLVDDPILKDAVAEMASGQAGADLPEEKALIAALDKAEPKATAAIDKEDFTGAMAALASLRKPIDAFFDHVTVNDPDAAKRERRLNLLMRFRDAVNRVADFSKIEG